MQQAVIHAVLYAAPCPAPSDRERGEAAHINAREAAGRPCTSKSGRVESLHRASERAPMSSMVGVRKANA